MSDEENPPRPTIPPHSIEAEESVIGGILVHARALVVVATLLAVDDFYHPALRAIFEAMLELDGQSKPVDSLTVAEQMRSMGMFDKLNAFGGTAYFSDLMAKVVTVENIGYHARIVARKAERRRWLDKLRELVDSGYAGGSDDAWFEQAESTVMGLSVRSASSTSDVVPIKTAMREFADELAARVERKKSGKSSIVGVSTGYRRVDELLSGLRRGLLYIIAGRPGSGKSAVAMNYVEESAKLGTAWLSFSLEMARLEVAQRMVSGNAKIDGQRLAQGDVSGFDQWKRVTGAVGRLAELPIWISDNPNVSIDQIRSKARRWRMGDAAKFEHVGVVIDYTQLVKALKKKQPTSREQDVSEISRGAKLLAREIDCPVIALAQLNRAVESRSNNRPMLSDLRESGAIEQDADVVAFMYRDAMYHDRETCKTLSCDRCAKHDVAEFIVGKQRSGPTGTVNLLWQGAFTRFESLAERDE